MPIQLAAFIADAWGWPHFRASCPGNCPNFTMTITATAVRMANTRKRFDSGGRLFGGFWETLPKPVRRHGIRIDGEPVVELDYSQLNPLLSYHIADAPPQLGDAYTATREARAQKECGIGPARETMNGSVKITLQPVRTYAAGMPCTVTALCAATGKTPEEVEKAIFLAARQLGIALTTLISINTRVSRRALANLGYRTDVDLLDPSPTVEQFMAANDHQDVVLVVTDGHMFAAQGKEFVDFDTQGRIEKYAKRTRTFLDKARLVHFVHVRGSR